MEDNMAGVGNILGNLKNMASDMGAEIEKQNKQLDLIQGKVIFLISLLIRVMCLPCFRPLGLMSGLSRLTRGLRNCLSKMKRALHCRNVDDFEI